jgi:hypothetical protein
VHSQCVNTDQCRLKEGWLQKLCISDNGHNSPKHIVHANAWCIYTRIVLIENNKHYLTIWHCSTVFLITTVLNISYRKTVSKLCLPEYDIYTLTGTLQGAYDNVVSWDTVIKAGRPHVRILMRSLNISIDLILPATLWTWGQLSL